MPTLPIPLFSSLVLGFLLIRMVIFDRRHGPLAVLMAVCAAQGVILSLAQHYHVAGFRVVQPISAVVIPPVAWIAFRTTAVRRAKSGDLMHIGAPILALIAWNIAPVLLDTFIPLVFVGYGTAILWFSAKGADALPRLGLEAGDLPARIWQVIGAALIGSGLTDVMIVVAQILGADGWRPWIISIYASGLLLVIGGLSLSTALVPSVPTQDEPSEVTEKDTEIFARLEALMAVQKPYLEPELSLSKLSRKLGIPVKQLSEAINKVTGENVSRYINAARIVAAKAALSSGENVTSAMLSSGFNTKSNFNREFLRVAGVSPSEWLQRS